MSSEITLIDYGVGNLFSVARALEHCGARVIVTSDAEAVRQAPKLLLPGVGAFDSGIRLLAARGLDQAIKDAVGAGASLLGVCLGMQFLLGSSDEFGTTQQGLGLIPGRVVAIPVQDNDGRRLKIPHIGWSNLIPAAGRDNWEQTPLQTTPSGTAMYFVHSFMASPDDPAHRIADCLYGTTRVAAMIGRGKVWGAQFHPEKSGKAGLEVLRRFQELD